MVLGARGWKHNNFSCATLVCLFFSSIIPLIISVVEEEHCGQLGEPRIPEEILTGVLDHHSEWWKVVKKRSPLHLSDSKSRTFARWDGCKYASRKCKKLPTKRWKPLSLPVDLFSLSHPFFYCLRRINWWWIAYLSVCHCLWSGAPQEAVGWVMVRGKRHSLLWIHIR